MKTNSFMKKLFSLFLAALLIVTCLPINVEAASIGASGSCGVNLKWYLTVDGTLIISGSGEMTNWDSSFNAPWHENLSKINKVSIEKGTTSIGDYAFKNCTGITEMVIPVGLQTIGISSFAGCSSLANMDIPKSITSIKESAFANCTALDKVYYEGSSSEFATVVSLKNNESLTQSNILYGCYGLRLSQYSLSVAENKSVTLNSAINKEIVDNELLSWSSSNNTIATVSQSGKITVKKEGKAEIVAYTPNGEKATCFVEVSLFEKSISIDVEDMIKLPQKSGGVLYGPTIDIAGYSFIAFSYDVGFDIDLKYCDFKYDPSTKKLLVKVGKLQNAGVESDDSSWKEEYNNIKQFTQFLGKETTSDTYNKFRDVRKNLKKYDCKLGFDFDTSFFGYFEFDCSTGEMRFSEGGMGIGASLDVGVDYHPIPIVYARLGLEAEIEAMFGLQCVTVEDSQPKFDVDLDITASIAPYLEVGGKLAVNVFGNKIEIFKLCGGIKGTFTGDFDLNSKTFEKPLSEIKSDFPRLSLCNSLGAWFFGLQL